MIRFLIFSLGFYISNITFSQNLIIDGGFDKPKEIPEFAGSIRLIEGCFTLSGTPDLFNSASTNMGNRNFAGERTPKNGEGYVGFIANRNEIIGLDLKNELDSGTLYKVSFHLSLSNKANCAYIPIVLTIGKVGDSGVEREEIVLYYNDSERLLESSGWIRVEGVFKAFGGENFATIKYHYDTNVRNVIGCFSYYYVDDVVVIPKVNESESMIKN